MAAARLRSVAEAAGANSNIDTDLRHGLAWHKGGSTDCNQRGCA
ncbi:hypothetical protein CAter282_1456 [Collimonas arenae]|uniref:Uncharacterized protein n=1 Tax=Collimonas arenae TaxID=279058 RepID=A0A127QHF9_9BURK|nr:hypothetical protein CAter282_1456 [Collimonas arenae]